MRKLSHVYANAKNNDTIELLATNCATVAAARTWCKRTGNKTIRVEGDNSGVYILVIQVSGKSKETSNDLIQSGRQLLTNW